MDENKLKEFKERKKAACKDWQARKAAEQKKTVDDITEFIDWIAKNKVSIPEKYMTALSNIVNPQHHRKTIYGDLLKQAFDGDIKVGAKVTLEQFMHRTFKGQNVLEASIKRWEKRGIVIEATPGKTPLETVYIIKAIQA